MAVAPIGILLWTDGVSLPYPAA